MKRGLTIVTVAALVALAAVAAAQKEQRGVTKTEIVLGMHTDLSGPAATYGVSSSNAVKMRFDDVNDKGGIQGRKIRLIVEDTQYQVPRAVQAEPQLGLRSELAVGFRYVISVPWIWTRIGAAEGILMLAMAPYTASRVSADS